MAVDTDNQIDMRMLEKVLLAKRVGRFLGVAAIEEERIAVENVARILSKDTNVSVREVLAFELRHYDKIPHDILDRIISDVEAVVGPFLLNTTCLDDIALAKLVPDVKETVRVHIAQRLDLGVNTQNSLAGYGGVPSISSMLDNSRVSFSKKTYNRIIDRFGQNPAVMDHMGLRNDLTKDLVVEIADKVSRKCKRHFFVQYGIEINPSALVIDTSNIDFMLAKIKGASSAQVHAFVADLRSQRNLNHELVVEMAEHGCLSFLESSLALLAGLPVGQVQEMMSLKNNKSFVKLMTMASVDKALAPRYLKIAKKCYGSTHELAA
jgi:uncharacterized protein (DUF2336 family)